jgi:hypothetical protein
MSGVRYHYESTFAHVAFAPRSMDGGRQTQDAAKKVTGERARPQTGGTEKSVIM